MNKNLSVVNVSISRPDRRSDSGDDWRHQDNQDFQEKINIRDTSSWAERIEHKKLSGSRKKPSMKTYDWRIAGVFNRQNNNTRLGD